MLAGRRRPPPRTRGPQPLRRVPIRLKITLGFLAAMAVVLAATGLFVYLRLSTELTRTFDQGLRSRTQDVRTLVAQTDNALRDSGPGRTPALSFTQVLAPNGKAVDFTPQVGPRPLLSALELRRAQQAPVLLNRTAVAGIEGPSRLLATPITGQDGRRLVVVAGASLAERNRSLAALGNLLLIGGPAALLLASLAGYLLTGAALHAVETMRRRAEELSLAEPGARLPVPEADDELRRLGLTLNAMLERNDATFAREQTFVSDASHELRTPLAVLRTELELALRGTRSARELRQALVSAVEETDRLNQLAEDLLIIARTSQGQLPLRPGRFVIADAFDAVKDRFSQRGEKQQQPLAVDLPPAHLELDADPRRVQQALSNMVENALRHGDGPIVLRAERRDGQVELHVTDEGHGFPSAFLATAFERFTRADAARTTPGSGLGLAIVRTIARAHGGDAYAVNRTSGGADVWITLPDAQHPTHPAEAS